MKRESSVIHPEWSRNSVIYEVNLRQYTPEGTFNAFEQHLPRLKELGVDILWLMPVNPLGVVNRKGIIGSNYCIKDYRGINLDLGTIDDFKDLVKIDLHDHANMGTFTNAFTGETVRFEDTSIFSLKAWEYIIFSNKIN